MASFYENLPEYKSAEQQKIMALQASAALGELKTGEVAREVYLFIKDNGLCIEKTLGLYKGNNIVPRCVVKRTGNVLKIDEWDYRISLSIPGTARYKPFNKMKINPETMHRANYKNFEKTFPISYN